MSEGIKKVLGDKLIGAKGAEVSVDDFKDKVVGLYFSAHWCPPCRQFTPVLATAYTNLIKDGKAFEVVFVSSDQDQESFDEYFGSMPWKSVPFSDEERRQKLGEEFGIRGIPALIILNADGKVISKDGRADITKNKEKAFDIWAAAK